MDAAHKLLKKTALLLATALLIVAPALAQTQLIVSSTTVGLSDNQARSVQVTASGAAVVTYTVSGVPFWLSTTSSNGFKTPDILFFQLANTNCGTCTAAVVLTPAGGGTPVTITVTYAPGGGGSNGTLTATPSSLTFSAFAGQTAPSQNVTISTTSASAISFTTASDQPTWLSSSANSFSVTSASPATLTVSANAFNLANGTYTGHIILTPSSGTATSITVTFSVGTGTGGGTGTIVATPSALTMSAISGQNSTIQTVSLSTASVNPVTILGIVPDVSWLSIGITSLTVSSTSPATLSVQASAATLANGTYTGHLTINPAGTGNTPTTITITFNVGTSGTTGTIVATPASLTFSATPGQITAQQSVSLTNGSGTAVTISGASADVNWLSLGGITFGQGLPATLTVTANAVSLTNGTYTGHITITPSSGTATVIAVTFNVGTGTGGGTGTVTASQSSFSFSYPSNSLSGVLTIGTSNQALTSFNLTVASQSNWLLFQNVGAGTYSPVTFGTFTVSVNTTVASSLPTGTYSGTLTLINPQNPNDTTVVNLTLTVNGGSGTGGALSLSPTALTFTASVGGPTQSQNLTVTAPSNATVQLNITTFNGSFFSVSSPSCSGTPNSTLTCTFTGSQTLLFTVNPAALTGLGTYSGQLQFVSGGATVTAFLTLNLIAPVTTLTVNPTSLAFTAAAGGAAQTQSLSVAVPGSALVQATITSFNGNFFTLTSSSCNLSPSTNATCTFNGNQTLLVTVNPAILTSAGNYTGNILLQSAGASINVPITLTLNGTGTGGGSTAIAGPASLAFAYQTGSAFTVPQQVVTVAATGAFTATASVQTSQAWLVVNAVGSSGPAYVIVSVTPQGLGAGSYQGTVTINSTAGTMTIPVTLTVTAGVVVEANPGNVYFSYQAGSAAVQQTIQLFASDNSATPVTASSSFPWITVGAPTSATTPTSFTLTMNPAGLCNGLNTGSVTVSAPNAINNGFAIPVVVLVSGSTATGCTGGGSTITVSPASLTYSYQTGGATPAAQTLTVSSTSGAAGVSFTYQVTGNVPITATANGVTVQNGQSLTTPTTLTLTPSVTGLTAATYNSTITLSPSNGSPVTVAVSLTVTGAAPISVSPTTLTFSYNAGSAAPSAQTVQVTGAAGLAFTASASSTGNWLVVSPAAGTTPASLSVSVNPTGLSANTYTGTITVTGTAAGSGTASVTVTLTVTAPLPTITSVGSSASYVGGSISPGEIIVIFGTSIGPTPGVTLALDPSTGKVATTLGGVQVVINGFLSPMVFASNTQVSAVVPYEICASSCGPGTIAQVVVKFLGQSSNGIPTPVAATTTGIFTANASGSGPGAILNANLTANSPGNPANKGDTVAIYLTGEGQTSPAGVTGKVTTVSSTGPLTPVPLLPVAVLIDGQPASISFAGEAPGLVSGAMQLNVQIPANARTGNLPLVVSIGGVSSQNGVTVSVR